jgi:hypothetical protein
MPENFRYGKNLVLQILSSKMAQNRPNGGDFSKMKSSSIFSTLAGRICLILYIMIVENVFQHLAMVSGHA